MQCANILLGSPVSYSISFTAVSPPLVGTESPKQLVPEAVLAWGLGDRLEGNKGETKNHCQIGSILILSIGLPFV